MMKKILSLFMIISILTINLSTLTANAQSAEYDSKYIKVGIERNVPSKSTIKLSGEGFTVGVENGNIGELFKINSQDVVANIKNFSYHIELSERFNSYDNALERVKSLKSLGMDSYVVYAQGFKVWIGEFGNEDSAKTFLASTIMLDMETTNISTNELLTSIENSNGEKIISFDKNEKIYIKSLGDLTKVENKRYRGYVGFVNKGSKLAVINYVQIGDYLKGVVPREMSASWNIEALKAQAVAARNYSIRNLGKHSSAGFDLCDSVHCQVYDGYEIEHPNSNRAVEETKSKVLIYNGKVAETVYSSCSGGYTANNEDVWSGSPIAYLRGKEDPYSTNTPQSNWTYIINKSVAEDKLRTSGNDVGQIISMETTRDSLGGRVLELKVTGTKGTKVISKDKVRTTFGLKSANYRIEGSTENVEGNPSEEIPSEPNVDAVKKDVYVMSQHDINPKKISIDTVNVVTSEGVKKVDSSLQNIVLSNGVEKIILGSNKPKEEKLVTPNQGTPGSVTIGNNITFKGNGWGHGVGMSQYGALNMAKAGHDFREILEFYYTGSRVE